MMTSTSLRGRGHAPRAAAAAAFVAAATSLIAVAFVAFFAVAFFSTVAFLAVAAAAAAASVAAAAVAIAPRLRRRFLAILALLSRVDDLSLLRLEALGLAFELPVLLVRLLLGEEEVEDMAAVETARDMGLRCRRAVPAAGCASSARV